MAESILYGIASAVLQNLGSSAVDEIALAWGFRGRLDRLRNTINTIKDVLQDAEEKQANSHAVRGWLERLSTAVYAADDLFDEFATVASRKQLMSGNKLSKGACTFFSRNNQITFAFNISCKIKSIRQQLDDIVNDSAQFAFVLRPHEEHGVVYRRREQSYSFVDAEEVIGRDGDKKAILDMLLPSSVTDDDHEVLPVVIPIVGIGGLGKTTLAKLVFNDPRVKEYFELRLWVCVSDAFDIKVITKKLLMLVTNSITPDLEMEQLHGYLRSEIADKKYLIVLDDNWNENREEWLELRDLLKIGRKGSKILVTTRSKEVATIMGAVSLFELKGLTEEKSCDLFQKMAFGHGQAQQNPHLMEIGKEIVRKCANVPLAIRALGSLLYGKDESKWLAIKETSLVNISDNENGIMEFLKLSYHHLQYPLKNCFAYCALFSKDYEFDKETLIDLWIAEGFIIPGSNGSKNLDELAEEYFLTLLQRCFFQDVKRDEWGAIKSFKMHDLMHDLALQVAGVKCKVAKLREKEFNGRIYHLSFDCRLDHRWMIPRSMPNLKLLRTFLLPEQIKDGSSFSKSTCEELILRFGCLRVLDLHNLGLESLPSSIGQLIHLRYLNLSNTYIEKLPKTITKLQNLQTLNLYWCSSLRKLPANISQLVNLRNLDFSKCDKLEYMPLGIEKLTSLQKLPLFIVNYKDPPTSRLGDLRNIEKLRGVLHIKILRELNDPFSEASDANLSDRYGLTELFIELDRNLFIVNGGKHDEALLDGLRPHHNLRKLNIKCFRGQQLPTWANNLCVSLPKLVTIELKYGKYTEVPSFSQLPSLKSLILDCLESVEYMEKGENDLASSSSSLPMKSIFFPSLHKLTLNNMGSLKGWWKEGLVNNANTKETSYHGGQRLLSLKSFAKLSELDIRYCPNLVIMPLCPDMEHLILRDTNKALSVLKMATTSSLWPGYGLKLKKLTVDQVEDMLVSLPKQVLHQLSRLWVFEDQKLVSTSGLGEVFTSLISLHYLNITGCHNLRFISKGLEQLPPLEALVFWDCKELSLSEDEDGMPWEAFKTSLRYLALTELPKLVALPSGLQHLANLRTLRILNNDGLRELPEWISCFSSLRHMELNYCCKLTSLPESFSKLTALQHLEIIGCDGLTKRCRGPNGRDWPKIQHIPLVIVRTSYTD